MIRISTHPASNKLYEHLEALFQNGEAYTSPHQHLSFVCGANSQVQDSLRTRFLAYLSTSTDHSILPILAEHAIDEFLSSDVGGHSKPDLAEFENLIGECVDSILIFPESPGSFAELGFFGALEKVRSKTLIVNLREHQGNSFINLGLIPIFNSNSSYNPMLIIEGGTDAGFENVVTRLQFKKSIRKYRNRFLYESFDKLSNKNQLIALYELIRVFTYITEQNLFESVKLVFKKYDVTKVKRLLAILVAMNFVTRNGNGDYFISKEAPALLEYDDSSFDKAKMSAVNFYQTNDPSTWTIVESMP
ncbi:MAG: retron St85 family effector protein [Methylotenera sp.]|nr:retron St85 family effector protein [Methylotenera sp.]MDD4926959.1 retron St85 family effector protein [Methylotenera sp.]